MRNDSSIAGAELTAVAEGSGHSQGQLRFSATCAGWSGRRSGFVSALAAAAALLGGCAGSNGLQLSALGSGLMGQPVETGSIKPAPTTRPLTESASFDDLAKAHAANPKEQKTALAYARQLKAKGQLKSAAAVLDAAGGSGDGSSEVLVNRGLLALELGEAGQAQRLITKAGPQASKDWRALSGLGVAVASSGRQKEAQRYFRRALELSPNNPSVLNNLAISYILDKNVDEAEKLLQQAATSGTPRKEIARNLQLIAALKTEGVGKL